MLQITEPYPLFFDKDGKPLESGQIFVGAPNQDARTSPIQLYRDEQMTLPIAQPVSTVNGRPAFQGTPVNLYSAESLASLLVLDRSGAFVVSNDTFGGYGGFSSGRATAITASKAKVDWVREDAGTPLKSEDMGLLWPNAQVYYRHAMSADFTAANSPVAAALQSPASTLTLIAHNRGSDAIVIPLQCIAWLHSSGDEVANLNTISLCDAGVTGGIMKGPEFDLQPAPGAGIVQSFGLAMNVFAQRVPGDHIFLEGIFGGYMDSGIRVGRLDASIGAGIYGAGAMGTLFNTAAGTYNNGVAGIFSENHALQFSAASGNARIVNSGGFLKVIAGANITAFRNNADSANTLTINGDGKVAIGALADAISMGSWLDVVAPVTTEGVRLTTMRNSAGTLAAEFTIATGTAGSAAAAAARFRANSSTGRSINAGGTINASGADYAEYERKRDDCGKVVKGQIIGFDADGLVTDRFADAISFGVKSTNPNLVGGDFRHDVGEAPLMPSFEPPAYEGSEFPGIAPEKVERHGMDPRDGSIHKRKSDRYVRDVRIAREEFERAFAKWKADRNAHAEKVAEAEKTHAAAMEQWEADMAAWEAAMNAARAPYDRIGYCGKVPVNVWGAAPGDHIVPADDGNGGITGLPVADAEITFAQYRRSVGQVRRILEDGRAEIALKVGG